MHRLYVVRSVKPTPPPREKHSAKVIELRVRREARRQAVRSVQPDRPEVA
jgi:hypothetical protein